MHQGVVLAAIGIKNKEMIEERVRVRGRMWDQKDDQWYTSQDCRQRLAENENTRNGEGTLGFDRLPLTRSGKSGFICRDKYSTCWESRGKRREKTNSKMVLPATGHTAS